VQAASINNFKKNYALKLTNSRESTVFLAKSGDENGKKV
jgi:hypothetical protein